MLNHAHTRLFPALGVVTLTTSALAGPLIVPVSQNREIKCEVDATDDTGSSSDDLLVTAPDFGPFDGEFGLSVVSPDSGSSGAGSSSQTSSISDSTISIEGSIFARAEVWDFFGSSFGSGLGRSFCEFRFNVTEEAGYRLDVSRADFEYGFAEVRFYVGDSFDLVVPIPDPNDEELTDTYQGVVQPGLYRLRAVASGDTFAALYGASASARGEFDVTLTFFCLRPEDLVVDGNVDTDDLLALFAAWGPCPSPCAADLAEPSGTVDVNDLLALFAEWGGC